MKISEETLSVVKNFQQVNNSLFFKKGNVVVSGSPNKVILAKGVIAEDFPVDFAIYELDKFLGAVKLIQSPEFDFKKDRVVIKGSGGQVTFGYASPEIIEDCSSKAAQLDSKLGESKASFQLTDAQLSSIRDAGAVLGLEELLLELTEEQGIKLTVVDSKNQSSNNFVLDIDSKNSITGKIIFKISNLKMCSGDYKVDIFKTKDVTVGRFQKTVGDLVYWIVTEASSKID